MSLQISMLIKGNPNSRGGIQPILNVGLFPVEEEARMDTPPIVREGVSYKIRHAADYIAYTIVDTNVRPADASRAGTLIIGVAIPKVLRLKDGKSPYTLLKELYNKFVTENMTSSSDGFHVFKSDPEKSAFEQLLQNYEVEELRGTSYVAMNQTGGIGVVCAPTEEKLEELFRDSQYPEFQQFCQIEVGRTCESSVNIEIPRKKEYHVFVNGDNTHTTLVNAYDRFDSSRHLSDTEFTTYEENHVSFTLEELTMSPSGTLFDGRVSMHGNRIDCEVKAKDKLFSYKALIVPPLGGRLPEEEKEKVRKLLEAGKLKVLFGGEDCSRAFVTGEEFLVIGANVKKQISLTVSDTEDYIFSYKNDRTGGKLELVVEIKKKKSVAQPTSPARGKEKPTPPVPISTRSDVLVVNFRSKTYDNYEAIITIENNDEKLYQLRQPITLIQIGKNEIGARMIIDNNWKNAPGKMFVQLKHRGQEGSVETSQRYELSFKNGQALVDIDKLDFEKNSSSSKWMRLGAVALATALIGGCIGFFIGKGLAGNGEAEELEEIKDSLKNVKEELRRVRQTNLLDQKPIVPEVTDEIVKEEPNVEKLEENPSGVNQNPPQAKDNHQKDDEREKIRKNIIEKIKKCDFNSLSTDYLTSAVRKGAINPNQRTSIEKIWFKRTNAQVRTIKDIIEEGTYDLSTIEKITAFSNNLSNILEE